MQHHSAARRLMLAAAGLLLVAAGWTQGPVGNLPPVARVAGAEIDADAFAARYAEYLLRAGLQDEYRWRRAFVDYLVDLHLVGADLRAGGIEADDAYRHEHAAVARKLLLDAYVDRVLFDTLDVSEADLRAVFVRMNTELKARHLYARTREQAEALQARLQAGEAFEALAREVFADSALAAAGGSVGYFGFDEMDPAFEDAAFALGVGEVSPPVRTAQGYSIIQLEDRRENPVLTEADYEAKRSQLRLYVLRRKRTEALAQHSQARAEALAPAFDARTLARLEAQVRGTALAPEGEAEAAWLAAPLVTFGAPDRRRTWTVADFRERAAFTGAAQRAQVRTRSHLEAFIVGLAVREEMLEQARAAGLDREAVYHDAHRRAMALWLYDAAKTRAAAAAVLPEDSLRAYFEENRDRYDVPEQVFVREILVETKAEAEALQAQLGTASFEALARTHSIRPGADATGGALGFLARRQLGRLADAAFGAEAGAVVGPLEVAGRYVLLQVGPRQAPQAAAFDAARDRVAEDLRPRYAEAAFQKYLRTLRTRYDVAVDEAALAAVRVPIGMRPE